MKLSVACALTVFAAMGCERRSPPAPAPLAPKPTASASATGGVGRSVELTEKDAGKAFEVRGGDTVVITLSSNPSTGYYWRVVDGEAVFGRMPSEYLPADRPGEGAPSKQRFVARVPAGLAGEHGITLAYRQGESPPSERELRFVLRVTR